jgi:hypothetical protein
MSDSFVDAARHDHQFVKRFTDELRKETPSRTALIIMDYEDQVNEM